MSRLSPAPIRAALPTCADAVLSAGLRRLVCAIPDPNPVVSGRGFAQLRRQGVEVDVGLLADEARWVTLGHILRQTAGRPFVQLKMALDAKGQVAAGNGAPVWVTGPEARAYAHLLRAEADAILVGSGTVLADDPELTCRLPGMADRSPDRIVLDTRLRTPTTAKIYRRAKSKPRVWVAAAVGEEGRATTTHGEDGPQVFDVGSPDGRSLDLDGLLDTLADRGITRLMVEGGPTVWMAFLNAGFVDEVCIVTGHGTATGPAIPVIKTNHGTFLAQYQLREHSSRMLGPDRLVIYRRDQA